MRETLLTILVIAIAIIETLLLIRIRYDRLVKKIEKSLISKPSGTVFTSEMVANLDEPVQRYFLHAIKPGTPLSTHVELKMGGSFRPKPDAEWLPMKASQIISADGGFVWKASIGRGFNKFSGADYYHQHQGRMRFFLWGLIPVVDAQNKDINRSAIGRLAGEYALWLPSALLPQNGIIWKAIANNTIQAKFTIDNEPIALTLRIDSEGKILKLSLPRWGDRTATGSWQYIPFGGEIESENTFGGYTVPSQMNAGWWFDTDRYGASFHPKIEQANFL